MKRSTKIKILTSMVCILMMVMCLSSTVLAAKSGGSGIDPSNLTPSYDPNGSSDMASWAGKIMGIIRNVAVIASVIVLMVIGVKFILGSTEEKAEYKKSLMPIVIGI